MNSRQQELLDATIREFQIGGIAAEKAFGRLCFQNAAFVAFDGDATSINETAEKIKSFPLGKLYVKAMRILLGDAVNGEKPRGKAIVPCKKICLPENSNIVEMKQGKRKRMCLLDVEKAKASIRQCRNEAKLAPSRGAWLVSVTQEAIQEKEEKQYNIAQFVAKLETMRKEIVNLPQKDQAFVATIIDDAIQNLRK